MKNKIILFTFITWVVNFSLHAQIGGNQIYQNNSSSFNRKPVETTSIFSTDSTLIITSKVLMNKKAAHYIITASVNQNGKTVIETNK